MQEMMRENEANRAKREEKILNSKRQEIEMQREANRMGAEMSACRSAELEKKNQLMKAIIIQGENVMKKQRQKKNKEEEEMKNYIKTMEVLRTRKEQVLKERAQKQKAEYKEFLKAQVLEKKHLEELLKEDEIKQAESYRRTKEGYKKDKENIDKQQLMAEIEHKKCLRGQIDAKEKLRLSKKNKRNEKQDEDELLETILNNQKQISLLKMQDTNC